MGDKFKEKHPKLAAFLANKAPQIGNVVGSFLPDQGALGILKNIISSDPSLSETDKAEALLLVNEAMKFYNEEMNSARTREVEMAKAGEKDNTPPILAYIAVAGFIVMVSGLFFIDIAKLSAPQGLLIGTMLGVLGSNSQSVYGYYFGSSSGSKSKSDQIDKLIG